MREKKQRNEAEENLSFSQSPPPHPLRDLASPNDEARTSVAMAAATRRTRGMSGMSADEADEGGGAWNQASF